MSSPVTVWSVGHSTLELKEFVSLLHRHGIGLLADIRSVPKSRRHPHFHTDQLAWSLPEENVRYERIAQLGGWRATSPDSLNGAWRNGSFRGYADHALTDEFAEGLETLRGMARSTRTAMMCSEALWWRCHRRLVADRLVVAGDSVLHITANGRVTSHALTPFAVVSGDGRLLYPSEGDDRNG